MARLFISHSRNDETFARQLAGRLDDEGADVWLDTFDLASPRWHNDLADGFENSDAMVVILTAVAAAERKVIGDWNAYFERRKPVVLIAPEDPDRFGLNLQPGQYVDFHTQSFDAGMRQLIETLRFYNALPPEPVTVPVQTIPAEVAARAAAVRAEEARRPGIPLPALRRDPALTQPAQAQETGAAIPAPRRERRLLLPIALGLLLVLLVAAGLIFLVLLPQQNQINEQATQTQLALVAEATLQAQLLAATQAAEEEALSLTQIALQQETEPTEAIDPAATATALMGTAQAQMVVQAITQTAQAGESLLADAQALGALQLTLSAQQAADRGIPPATPPTSNRFANQSLIFNLQRELFIGAYAVRLWQDATLTYQVLTIDHATQPRIQIDSFLGGSLNDLTGSDITGEGNPDVVYEMSYGGATGLSCSVWIYNLGATASKIVETPPGACGGRFADLNGDGVRELIIADTTFAYQFCSGAESPLIEAVLAYDRMGRTFRPQSANFPAYYRAQAEAYKASMNLGTMLPQQAQAGNMESVKCAVLGVVLPYLYGGMSDIAWREFATYYPYPDAAAFRARILDLFTNSPFCK